MECDRSGVVLVLCAPSGTGKSTLAKRLLAEFSQFAFSVSYTTRPPREGEVDGREYTFVDEATFKALRDERFFAEWAEVHGNFYGTPLENTRALLAQGRDVLFDIDVQGASQLYGTLKQGCYVFILPPSMRELERRLRARGTDAEEIIKRRMANARRELQQAHWFNAWVVNDDLNQAYDRLRATYLAETLSPACRPGLLETLLAEWS